jgi:hypothetical protein
MGNENNKYYLDSNVSRTLLRYGDMSFREISSDYFLHI